MWQLDYKESWVPEDWYFWTVVLEKTFERPLDCKIKPVHPKGNQSWIFIGRTDPEAETLIFWPPDVKNWFTGKDCDARKDWRQKEKRTTEDEMVGCITDSMDMSWSKPQELVMDREPWRAAVHEVTKSHTRLNDWTQLNYALKLIIWLVYAMWQALWKPVSTQWYRKQKWRNGPRPLRLGIPLGERGIKKLIQQSNFHVKIW